jgi:hypothetical protein
MGFAIVHSAALMVLVAVAAPGFYVAFFNLVPSDLATLILSFAVNAIYYCGLGLLALMARRKSSVT